MSYSVCRCVTTSSGGGGGSVDPPGGGECYFYSDYYYSDGELMNGNSCTDTYLIEGFVCDGVFSGSAQLVSHGCNNAQ